MNGCGCLIFLITVIIYYLSSVSINTFWIVPLTNWCLTFCRVYRKGWTCIYLSIELSRIFKRFGVFDLATSAAILNRCACCSKVCLLSINSALAINSAILIFSSCALSSFEDLWLDLLIVYYLILMNIC